MTAPGNSIVQVILALAFVIASGYAAGRIHQWYKQGIERDEAYRNGYDRASRAMFDLATRKRGAGQLVEGPPAASPAAGHRAAGRRRRRAKG